MGLGIVGMHYIGMSGMQMEAVITYDPWLVGVSILIALGASTSALWLFSNKRTVRFKIAEAGVMGGAISGMHYTAMAAATFVMVPSPPSPSLLPPLSPVLLAASVAGITSLILVLALFAAHVQSQRLALQAAEAFQRRLSSIATNLPGILYRRVLHPDGTVSYPYVSDTLSTLFGADEHRADRPPSLDHLASEFLCPDDRDRW
jgi:hypothetical protein